MKYYGSVGYATTEENPEGSGIYKAVITERKHAGDVVKRSYKWQTAQQTNDNLTISQDISIMADPYDFQNIGNIRYIEYMGIKWSVANADIQYPRIVLTLGGVYHGDET